MKTAPNETTKSRATGLAIIMGTALAALPASSSADETAKNCKPVMVQASEMKWTDSPALPKGMQVCILYGDMRKAEPIGFRIKIPAGGMLAPHTHPVDERVTVISGAFAMGHGEKFDQTQLKELPVGSISIFPAGCPMFVFAKEDTVIQVNVEGPWGITYVNPEDDPRKK